MKPSARILLAALSTVAVAALATVLSSSLSPEVRNQSVRAVETSPAGVVQRFGICETPGVAQEDNVPASAAGLSGPGRAAARTAIQKSCDENILGFETTYRVTFFAAMLALVVALFLPGWPGAWAGRAGLDTSARPVISGGH